MSGRGPIGGSANNPCVDEGTNARCEAESRAISLNCHQPALRPGQSDLNQQLDSKIDRMKKQMEARKKTHEQFMAGLGHKKPDTESLRFQVLPEQVGGRYRISPEKPWRIVGFLYLGAEDQPATQFYGINTATNTTIKAVLPGIWFFASNTEDATVWEQAMSPDDFEALAGLAISLGVSTGIAAFTGVLEGLAASPRAIKPVIRLPRTSNATLRVNVGGTGESPGYVNLNPIKEGSGGQTKAIPNLIKDSFENMSRIFKPGSVKELISNRLRFVDVSDWASTASGAYKTMAPGGKISMNIWAEQGQANVLLEVFKNAGFRNVRIDGSGVGTMLTAIK